MAHNLIVHPEADSPWDSEEISLSRWQVARYSGAEEQYRVLSTQLRTMIAQPGSPGRVVALTSALPGEGKTANSVNLAMCLARDFQYRVLLIEGDLKRPSISRGNSKAPGMAEYISGDVPLNAAIRPTQDEGLHVMAAGQPGEVPTPHILGSALLQRTMLRLRERYDFVIVDCPPMLAASDLGLVAEWCDHFLLVVKAASTDRSVVRDALARVPNDKFIGAVLSNAQENDAPHYGLY